MKPRPIKKYGPTWTREANNLARDFSPPIHTCQKCSYPVIDGYCCTYCGDVNPSQTNEQDEAFERKYGGGSA